MRPIVPDSTVWIRSLFRALLTLTLIVAFTAVSFDGVRHLTGPQAALADDNDDGDDDEDEGDNDDDDDGGPADTKDKDKDKGKDKDKDDPDDHDQGQGNDDRADPPSQGAQVTQLREYRVVVECALLDDGRSACMFVGLGDTGVKRVAVPETTVCATVDGKSDDGDAPEANLLSATTGEPSYVSDDAVLLLVLAGTVETNATTTYWIWADDDQLYPAIGPALTCDQPPAEEETAAAPPTTGSIVIRAFACDPGVASGADVDWYAACTQPATDATFSVTAAVAGTANANHDGTTDDDGRLAVPDLSPGTYQVEQTDGNWCHAESDNVDDQGDVVVEAGVESTIWVFDCQA